MIYLKLLKRLLYIFEIFYEIVFNFYKLEFKLMELQTEKNRTRFMSDMLYKDFKKMFPKRTP